MSFLEILPQEVSKGPSTSKTGGNLCGAMVGCTGRLYNWGWHQGEQYISLFPFDIWGVFLLLFNLICLRCFIKMPKQTQDLSISLASTTLHTQMSSHSCQIQLVKQLQNTLNSKLLSCLTVLKSTESTTHVLWCFGFVSLQICSPAEKKAIDKMIDSGPQLAGSMEYNVVLSEWVNNRRV